MGDVAARSAFVTDFRAIQPHRHAKLMCGICGIWQPSGGQQDNRLQGMLETIVHRGPDGEGRLARDGVALGMRRLAIIDLAGGDQPIFNEDGSIAVVFNGEIYNFQELRRELERAGHTFRTRSDTEVIVHGYEEWGDDVAHHLAGMFAFAVFDEPRHRVVVIRDRFGEKPLYYAHRGEELVLASEIKAILAAGISRDIDPEAVAQYLHLRYVLAPRTMFRDVRQLPAGHQMTVDSGGVAIRRWWRLRYGPKRDLELPEAVDHVGELLGRAVERRLVSEVPLGCFLSGGLDSSLVLSFMAAASDQPVRTFSVGFDRDWAGDELHAAAQTAQAFGANHSEFRLGPDEFLRLLPIATWHRDEPLAEPSEIPLLALSRAAREHVTVVLSGEGGDELMGGYPKYRVDHALELAGRAARSLLGARRVDRIANWERLPRKARLAVGAMALGDDGARWAAWFGADRASGLANPLRQPLDHLVKDLHTLEALDRMLAVDVESYLVDNLLVRGDKMTMAASIEGRMPLLDHDLAEFVARLPAQLKATPRRTKRIARELARRRLPHTLLERPKIGFAVPVSAWFRGELGRTAERLLLSPEAARRGLVAPERTRTLLGAHRTRRYDFGKELWSLLCLEVWARIYLDRVDPAELDLSVREGA